MDNKKFNQLTEALRTTHNWNIESNNNILFSSWDTKAQLVLYYPYPNGLNESKTTVQYKQEALLEYRKAWIDRNGPEP